MSRTYRIVLPILFLWLVGWILIAWPALQDDALIYLRYADNLRLHHFLTYDGIHSTYGASSLLYIAILSLLRSFTSSPQLTAAVSSIVHILLFAGLAIAFAKRIPPSAHSARLAALTLLILLATPSSVRWLDDGMETGIIVAIASLLAWIVHAQHLAPKTTRPQYLLLTLLGFLAVLLRIELLLLCVVCFLILCLSRSAEPRLNRIVASSHILLGALLAVAVIVLTTHKLLPDTAVAKAHGISRWIDPFHTTAITLTSAMSFGLGMLLFWILTFLLLALCSEQIPPTTWLANIFFPTILILASLRGQEIQGARYFAWAFFFSAEWNILELAHRQDVPQATRTNRQNQRLLSAFLLLLAVAMPLEAITMARTLVHRADTVRLFESQHLDVLQSRRGIAAEIGFIGYFTQADICDLNGLVSGRASARLTSKERLHACASTTPDFLFLTLGQLESMAKVADLSGWQTCGRYDLPNLRTPNIHYLLVAPSLSSEVCQATGKSPAPIYTLLSHE
jgi:hypothetical protein